MTTEAIVRMSFSMGGLALFMALGLLFPFQKNQEFTNKKRWFSNLSFTFGNAVFVRLFLPLALIDWASSPSMDPFHLIQWPNPSSPVVFLFGLVLLDCVIYWQHRLTHRIPWLWRLHRVHHSDPVIDATSAGRFHTLEIVLSFFVKLGVAVVFNLPTLSILVFEILLNFSSLFNHTNVQLPKSIEKWVSRLIITPDLHRIHHSVKHREMNSNFGFSISLWDQIFRSYKTQASSPQKTMPIGIDQFRDPKEQTLRALFMQPLQEDSTQTAD